MLIGWVGGCIVEIKELVTVGKQLSRHRQKQPVHHHLTVWKGYEYQKC